VFDICKGKVKVTVKPIHIQVMQQSEKIKDPFLYKLYDIIFTEGIVLGMEYIYKKTR